MARSEYLDLAHNHLLSYCSLINPKYLLPNHLRIIAKVLESVERGEKKRVVIALPPRHGKSQLCSRHFPAWYLGRNSDKSIIAATYGQDLADDFGRSVRDQMVDPVFRGIFNVKLREDTQSVRRMITTDGGEYFAVGAGAAITGRGAHILLIDDPIKNREEADSEQIREKDNAWYDAVAYTRLMPGGAVVIIMTRWHEHDLVGHVLQEHKHEGWEVITLKAINDEGKALWPEAYDIDVLRNIEKTLTPYDWYCLYQQEPIPREGIIFKAEHLPSGLDNEYSAAYAFIDPAISEKETACETAITVFGVRYATKEHPETRVDEIETIHGRWPFRRQLDETIGLYEKYKNDDNLPTIDLIGVEKVQYQEALGQELHERGLPAISIKVDRDKYRRGMSVSHWFSQGRVRINNPKLKKQLLSFRGQGEENDLADAAISCVKMMIQYSSNEEKPIDRYDGLSPMDKEFWKDYRKALEKAEKGDDRDYTSFVING